MTDEAFVFRQTERERKRVGRGAFNKKSGSKSKKCSLPSDYLTAKERKAMNGEVKTFKEKPFYSYDEWKALPDDLKLAHINSVLTRYDCGLKTIAEVEFGISKQGLRYALTKYGISEFVNASAKGKGCADGRHRLEADVKAARHPVVREATAGETVEISAETPVEAVPERLEIAPDTNTVVDIAAVIAALRGTGAKITIEVTL